jgi:hypothetical protein
MLRARCGRRGEGRNEGNALLPAEDAFCGAHSGGIQTGR